MKNKKRNVFDDRYALEPEKLDNIEREITLLLERMQGLQSMLIEVKANTNNIRANLKGPIHGRTNQELVGVLNSIRDLRVSMLEVETHSRDARRSSRDAARHNP